MKLAFLFASVTLFLFSTIISAQKKPSPLDDYVESAGSILVVKCLRVGPVNILLRANVDVEVLQVVKGPELKSEIEVDAQFGMQVGKYYLIRSSRSPDDTGRMRIDERNSVIQIVSADEAEKLKGFSPRIIVLRTMNLRVDTLESEIRTRTFELESLQNARKEN